MPLCIPNDSITCNILAAGKERNNTSNISKEVLEVYFSIYSIVTKINCFGICWFYSLGAFPGENTMPWVHLNFAFMPWVQSRLWATSKANASQAAWFHWMQSHRGQSIIFLSPKISWILHKEQECSDIALNNFLCPECVCDNSPGQGQRKGLRGPGRDSWECFQPKPCSV